MGRRAHYGASPRTEGLGGVPPFHAGQSTEEWCAAVRSAPNGAPSAQCRGPFRIGWLSERRRILSPRLPRHATPGPVPPVAVRHQLPTLPLWLRGGLCLPVELE